MIGAAKVKHVHLACVYIEKQWKSSAVEREKNPFCVNRPLWDHMATSVKYY